MNIIDNTDEEILEIAIPYWEDLIKYSNKGQYGKFVRNFSYDLLARSQRGRSGQAVQPKRADAKSFYRSTTFLA